MCFLCLSVVMEHKEPHNLPHGADIRVGQGKDGEVFFVDKAADNRQQKLHKFIFDGEQFQWVWSVPLHSRIKTESRKHVCCTTGRLIFQNKEYEPTYYCEHSGAPSSCLSVTCKHDQAGEFVACLSGNRCAFKFKRGSVGSGLRAIRVVCNFFTRQL